MSLPRFYLEPQQWRPNNPVLAGPEAHHARDVLRIGPGDEALLFDGRGHELLVEAKEVGRREIRFRTIEEREAQPRQTRITLAQAIPKGKNMDLIVQKAVELGAAEIVPILSERTVVSLDKKDAASKQEKWQQVVIEAAKQCGQNWLPEIGEPLSLREFLGRRRTAVGGPEGNAADTAAATEEKEGRLELRVIASTQGDSLHLKSLLKKFESEHGTRPMRVTVLVGPEGDFSPAEYQAARDAGFQAITLGSIILRVETAAIYCLSVLGYELGTRQD